MVPECTWARSTLAALLACEAGSQVKIWRHFGGRLKCDDDDVMTGVAGDEREYQSKCHKRTLGGPVGERKRTY